MQKGLEYYIVKLLTQHDCVIIPGLGGFVVQHESAQLLPDCIIPPHATVGFNPLLTHTDGHLAALLMRSEGIANYREASALIQTQVSEWMNMLQQGQTLTLGELGSLCQNKTGQLHFTPGNLDFLPANFGLSPVYRKQPAQQPATVVRMSPSYLRYAACVAFMIVCLLLPYEGERYVDTATLDPTIWVRPAVEEQTIVEQAEAESLTIEEVAEQLVETPAQTIESVVAHRHHLIVASVDQTSADAYCMQLKSEGHLGAHVIPYKNGYHRVAIHSYATRTEALQAMEALRATETRFAKAWVFCE